MATVVEGIRPEREDEEKDEEAKTDARLDLRNELLWKLIGTRAVREYQVGYKFDMLTDMTGSTWNDARVQCMIESIRSDTVGRY